MMIPILGQSSEGRSVNVDAGRSINFFPELNSKDAKSQLTLVGTPGTSLFKFIGIAPIRGTHVFNDKMYVVSGSSLFELDATGAITSTVTTTLQTSNGRVSFADNGLSSNGVGGDQLCLVDGVTGYIYNVNTTTFSTIAALTTIQPFQVEYIDGYFVVINRTMTAYCSDPYDGTTWRGLAFAAVMGASDNIQTLVNTNQQLLFIKEYTSEFWFDAGVPTINGFPFARQPGAVLDFGTPAPWSVARGNFSIFFLASQRIGNSGEFVGVVEMSGGSPKLISPPSIVYQIHQMIMDSTITDAFGYCYSDSGHLFYVLTFPTANRTFVYDAATQMWHERSTYTDNPAKINRHCSNTYSYFNNKHYVGDYRNGSILEMSSAYYYDIDLPIISQRITQHLYDPEIIDPIYISKLQVDAETGVGGTMPQGVLGVPLANGSILADGKLFAGSSSYMYNDPKLSLAWSKDGGHTWSSEYPRSMGKIGEYKKRIVWTRLGRGLDRIFRLTCADPVKKILINGFVEAAKG